GRPAPRPRRCGGRQSRGGRGGGSARRSSRSLRAPLRGDARLSFLQALAYFFREALVNLLRSWKVSLLAVLTITVSLLLGGTFLVASRNLSEAVERWRGEMKVVLYLKPDAPPAQLQHLAAQVKTSAPWAASVEAVSAAAARERFQESF